MKTKVLIVGGGEIGTALSKLLKDNKKLGIDLWDIKKSLCTDSKILSEAVKGKELIFLCIPSFAIASCASDMAPHISRKTTVISLTKGLERKTGKLSSEILLENFGWWRTGILAGPMLAEELNMGLSTKAVLASKRNTFLKVQKLFKGTHLSIEHWRDMKGVSIAGVLKNVYALSLGIAEALKLGSNAKGVLLKMALEEMQILTRRLGGNPKTVLTLAGIGDLQATGNSKFSHNHAAGQEAVHSKKKKLTSEGALSMPPLLKRLGHQDLPPLLKAIRDVVVKRKDARETFLKLLSR